MSTNIFVNKEDGNEMNIYANADDLNIPVVFRGKEDADATKNQASQHTGSECVKNRIYRSVTVCLVLLCVFLLTAVIVLCVLIYTNNHLFHINNKNHTEEIFQLLTNVTEERDQLMTNNIDLIKERDQLLTNNIDLIKERDQLLIIKKEKDRLLASNTNLNRQKEELTQQINQLWKILNEADGWIYYKLSLYHISSAEKSWSDSRRYCKEKGADLIIINNKEEQDFVNKYSGSKGIWIGLSDGEKEGTWKWVDGSTPNTRFWVSGEPNSIAGNEDCVVSQTGWADWPCNVAFKYICEKKVK